MSLPRFSVNNSLFVNLVSVILLIIGLIVAFSLNREIFPNVYVAGMCANAAFGSYRMGPIFGGMLISGRKVARIIAERLESEKAASD